VDYINYFKNKRITIMGLGLLGRGIGDAKFLAECGAKLIVTDLKSETELAPALAELSEYKNITYVLGEHRLQDFENRDFILKAAGVPLDSIYIEHARKNNIPIEMDASLFAKLAKGVKLIGVTGTRGKTTTTCILYEILKTAGMRVFLSGNIKGKATLPLLSKVEEGDYVLLELDSWQLQGFGEAKISPQVAIFTTFFPDHMNYYKQSMERYFEDKANIFKYQKKDDVLVVGKEVFPLVEGKTSSKVLAADVDDFPRGWTVYLPGEHNRLNIACALKAATALGVSRKIVSDVLGVFRGVSGRLELIKIMNKVRIYNDTTATTPEATLAGIKALSYKKNIVLIMGGSDKGLDMSELVKNLETYCKGLVFLSGTGTEKLLAHRSEFEALNPVEVKDLKEALDKALEMAGSDDIVLFSPAFASFGMFKNEYDRGDQFTKLVRAL